MFFTAQEQLSEEVFSLLSVVVPCQRMYQRMILEGLPFQTYLFKGSDGLLEDSPGMVRPALPQTSFKGE